MTSPTHVSKREVVSAAATEMRFAAAVPTLFSLLACIMITFVQ